MFSDYFIQLSDQLKRDVSGKAGKTEAKKKGSREKNQKDVETFISFLQSHLPDFFSVSTGKVRSKKHFLNRGIDVLVYHKKLPMIEAMSGGYILSEYLYSFLSVEAELTARALSTHVAMTNALKTLYRMETGEGEDRIVKLYSILFAYDTEDSLDHIRTALLKVSSEKDIPVNGEADMVCVLNKGLIIKDWENGSYQVIETAEDTLMWFYILLLEYLDRDGAVGFDPRSYVKQEKDYRQY